MQRSDGSAKVWENIDAATWGSLRKELRHLPLRWICRVASYYPSRANFCANPLALEAQQTACARCTGMP